MRLEQGFEGAVGPGGAEQPAELAGQGQEVECSLQGHSKCGEFKALSYGRGPREQMS